MSAAQTAAPPAEANGAGDPEGLGELVIAAGGQLGFDVGGKRPTGSSLTLTGGKFRVEGSFKKGDRLGVTITDADGNSVFAGSAVVDDIGFKDETDSKTGQVVGCERRHKARISAVLPGA